jgi:chromosome segregation ATPase
MTHQVGELTILESSARSECLKLQQQIASIAAAQEVLHSHLANSRSREVGYETRLTVLESVKIPNGHVSSSSSNSSSSGSSSSRIIDSSAHDSLQHTKSDERIKAAAVDNVNNNNTEVSASSSGDTNGHLSPSHADSSSAVKGLDALTDTPSDTPLPTVLQVQERAKETQIELDEARASLNDLILEIESVSVEEARSREQSARILRQMADRYANIAICLALLLCVMRYVILQ